MTSEITLRTTGDADLADLAAEAARWNAEWRGGWVEIRATFATSEQREAAARSLAHVAGARVTTATSYGPDDTASKGGDRKRPARRPTRLRAQLAGAYRPRRLDPLSAPLIAVPLSLAILGGWIIAFVLFRETGPHNHLPGVALGSKFLLDVIRATLVVALIGAGTALILRSAFGNFPSEISTQGVKWTQAEVEERSGRQEQLTIVGGLLTTLHNRISALEKQEGGS